MTAEADWVTAIAFGRDIGSRALLRHKPSDLILSRCIMDTIQIRREVGAFKKRRLKPTDLTFVRLQYDEDQRSTNGEPPHVCA